MLWWRALCYQITLIQFLCVILNRHRSQSMKGLLLGPRRAQGFSCISPIQRVKVKVAQMCLTHRDPKDYTVHGILQARILEWVVFPFSRGSSQPRDWNPGLPHCRWILYQLSHKGSPMLVSHSCLTLCNSMDCSPPGSSVYGILQAKILVWVAISFSRGSPQPRDWTQVSCIVGKFFTIWATREAKKSPGACAAD